MRKIHGFNITGAVRIITLLKIADKMRSCRFIRNGYFVFFHRITYFPFKSFLSAKKDGPVKTQPNTEFDPIFHGSHQVYHKKEILTTLKCLKKYYGGLWDANIIFFKEHCILSYWVKIFGHNFVLLEPGVSGSCYNALSL